MKELKLYQCEICGTKYADKSKAKWCLERFLEIEERGK